MDAVMRKAVEERAYALWDQAGRALAALLVSIYAAVGNEP